MKTQGQIQYCDKTDENLRKLTANSKHHFHALGKGMLLTGLFQINMSNGIPWLKVLPARLLAKLRGDCDFKYSILPFVIT